MQASSDPVSLQSDVSLSFVLFGSNFTKNTHFPFNIQVRFMTVVNVSCRELAPTTVSLTYKRARGNDSKHYRIAVQKLDPNSKLQFLVFAYFLLLRRETPADIRHF